MKKLQFIAIMVILFLMILNILLGDKATAIAFGALYIAVLNRIDIETTNQKENK